MLVVVDIRGGFIQADLRPMACSLSQRIELINHGPKHNVNKPHVTPDERQIWVQSWSNWPQMVQIRDFF